MLEFYHQLGDEACARARRGINAGGLAPQLQIRNVHYEAIAADFRAHGGSVLPAIWDGATLSSGADAVLARLALLAPALQTERLRLREGTEDDVDVLLAIVQEPSVSAFWPDYDQARMRQAVLEKDDTTPFVITKDERAIGFIQFSEERDPEYRHAGIDLFIAPAWQKQGLGREAITCVANYLFDTRAHHRLTIDPLAENSAAIAAYSACGFKPIGVLRQYQRLPDGAWHDGLLMEMLATDRTG